MVNETENVAVEVKSAVITEERVVELWRNYAANIENEEIRTSKIMINNIPSFSNNVLQLELSSQLQEKAILALKGSILSFIKRQLNCDELSLIISINESIDDKKVFTASDRLEAMKLRNTALDLLLKKLDLDLD